jgi:hypothetical protein
VTRSQKAIIKAAAKKVFDAFPVTVPITRISHAFEDEIYGLCEFDRAKMDAKVKAHRKVSIVRGEG